MLRDIYRAFHFERSDRISMFVETTNTEIYKQEKQRWSPKTNIENDVVSVSDIIYEKLIFFFLGGGGGLIFLARWQEYRLLQYV